MKRKHYRVRVGSTLKYVETLESSISKELSKAKKKRIRRGSTMPKVPLLKAADYVPEVRLIKKN